MTRGTMVISGVSPFLAFDGTPTSVKCAATVCANKRSAFDEDFGTKDTVPHSGTKSVDVVKITLEVQRLLKGGAACRNPTTQDPLEARPEFVWGGMEETERPSQASRKTQSVSPARPEATSSEPREGEGEGRQRHRQSLRKLLDEQQVSRLRCEERDHGSRVWALQSRGSTFAAYADIQGPGTSLA